MGCFSPKLRHSHTHLLQFIHIQEKSQISILCTIKGFGAVQVCYCCCRLFFSSFLYIECEFELWTLTELTKNFWKKNDRAHSVVFNDQISTWSIKKKKNNTLIYLFKVRNWYTNVQLLHFIDNLYIQKSCMPWLQQEGTALHCLVKNSHDIPIKLLG